MLLIFKRTENCRKSRPFVCI